MLMSSRKKASTRVPTRKTRALVRLTRQKSGIPKVAFGKYRDAGGRVLMPVSVEGHHALMDGLHAGRFFERLQSHCSDPRAALGL